MTSTAFSYVIGGMVDADVVEPVVTVDERRVRVALLCCGART